MLAIWNGHRNVVQVLLQESFIIELNAANKDGDTALRIACIDGRREIIALLLEAEVNVNKISAVSKNITIH